MPCNNIAYIIKDTLQYFTCIIKDTLLYYCLHHQRYLANIIIIDIVVTMIVAGAAYLQYLPHVT